MFMMLFIAHLEWNLHPVGSRFESWWAHILDLHLRLLLTLLDHFLLSLSHFYPIFTLVLVPVRNEAPNQAVRGWQ